MSLKLSEVLKDEVVQKTIKSLEAQAYRIPGQAEVERDEMLQLLDETGALDSVTAAALIGETMFRGRGALPAETPKEVAEVMTRMAASYGIPQGDVAAAVAGMMSGNLSGTKLAVGAVVLSGSGKEFESAKQGFSPREMREMMREIMPLSLNVLETLQREQSWKSIEPALLVRMIESVENFGEYATGDHKSRLSVLVHGLREEFAQAGIELPPTKLVAPAELPAPVGGMTIAEGVKHPVVIETLKALGINDDEASQLTDHPLLVMMEETGSLDPVVLAAALVEDTVRGGSEELLAKLPKEVADVVAAMSDPDESPYERTVAPFFASDNHGAHKLGIAILALSFTGEQFEEGVRGTPKERLKEVVDQTMNHAVDAIDRIIEVKSWQAVSPALMSRFEQSITNLAGLVEGKSRKRLVETALQSLKEEVAKGTAAEITTPVAVPAPGIALDKVLSDPLVKQTIDSLSGEPGIYTPEQGEIEQHPVLKSLAATGDLDSLTAAVIVADDMTAGYDDMTGKMPGQVAEAVALLKGADNFWDGKELVGYMSGLDHPSITKALVGTLVAGAYGEEFKMAKSAMSAEDMQEYAEEVAPLAIDLAKKLKNGDTWKAYTPALMNHFAEALGNLGGLAADPALKQGLATAAQELQAARTGQDNAPVAKPAPAAKRKPGGMTL